MEELLAEETVLDRRAQKYSGLHKGHIKKITKMKLKLTFAWQVERTSKRNQRKIF